ncbi:Conserved_hypothetical protein [Hexamita inflata]|uniref:Uncharacterized protein n=1 Tax=Hexamita inflata TaxID=28002 RepID=A0AA86NTY2_9EUKA|nr:Conserved hypothetical protein [Hexamita inflata]
MNLLQKFSSSQLEFVKEQNNNTPPTKSKKPKTNQQVKPQLPIDQSSILPLLRQIVPYKVDLTVSQQIFELTLKRPEFDVHKLDMESVGQSTVNMISQRSGASLKLLYIDEYSQKPHQFIETSSFNPTLVQIVQPSVLLTPYPQSAFTFNNTKYSSLKSFVLDFMGENAIISLSIPVDDELSPFSSGCFKELNEYFHSFIVFNSSKIVTIFFVNELNLENSLNFNRNCQFAPVFKMNFNKLFTSQSFYATFGPKLIQKNFKLMTEVTGFEQLMTYFEQNKIKRVPILIVNQQPSQQQLDLYRIACDYVGFHTSMIYNQYKNKVFQIGKLALINTTIIYDPLYSLESSENQSEQSEQEHEQELKIEIDPEPNQTESEQYKELALQLTTFKIDFTYQIQQFQQTLKSQFDEIQEEFSRTQKQAPKVDETLRAEVNKLKAQLDQLMNQRDEEPKRFNILETKQFAFLLDDLNQ